MIKKAQLIVLITAWAGLLSPLHALGILMVQDTGGTATSQSLFDFLVAEGHTVTREARTGGPGDLTGIDLIIVTRETNSGNYTGAAAAYNAAPVPIISMAPHIMRANRWGWESNDNIPGAGTITSYDPYADPAHPFVNGVGTAILSPATAVTAISGPLPTGSTIVATFNGGA